MKTTVWLSMVTLVAASLSAADTDAPGVVKAAAKKLGDKANYSWTSTSKPEGDTQGPNMGIEGKTEKGGCTQLAFTFGDTTTDAVIKGDKVAVKRDDEWKLPDELQGNGAWMARRLQTFKAAAEEAEDLATKAKALKAGEGGLYSGDLTEAGVKEIFGRWRRGGAQTPEAKDAKGSVKFWIKDGALTKYEFNLRGTITMGQDQQEMTINRTTTVEIKDVDATKVVVPDAAKKKLS